MELDHSELTHLARLLNKAYFQIQDFAEVVTFAGKSPDDIEQQGTKLFRILVTLKTANGGGWLPDLLSEIVADDRFEETHGVVVEVRRLQDELQAREDELQALGGADPKDALVVYRRPFINRDFLREAMPKFANGNRSKVFIVNGPPASGKSFTWFFIRHYSEARAGAKLAKIDLSTRSQMECEPASLMSALAEKMGLDTSDMPNRTIAQDARISAKLTEWFVGQARSFAAIGQTWWVAFDSLDDDKVGPGEHDLMTALARAIEEGELENTWLFLFGLKRPLPVDIARFIYSEELDGIRSSELRHHLRELAEGRGVEFDDSGLDELVAYILEGMPQPIQHENVERFLKRLDEIVVNFLS